MKNTAILVCPGCGLRVDGTSTVAAPGGVAASECFLRFGELLAASYLSPARRQVHQLIVDTYTVQHGGGTGRREVQAVALCLMTLYLVLHDGVDPREGPALHKRMADSGVLFTWLEPPTPQSWTVTVDAPVAVDDDLYTLEVRNWAETVWSAWKPYQPTVIAWIAATLDR